MIRRPFRPQYEPLIVSCQKNQTVRPTPKRMPKIGEDFVGYVWTGRPYRSPQREFLWTVVTKVEKIEIAHQGWIWLDDIRFKTLDAADIFARADGFETALEFLRFFRTVHGLPFTGIVIHWRPPTV